MKAYLEAIRTFRKEIMFYQKKISSKSTPPAEKIIYEKIIKQLQDDISNLMKKTADFYSSLNHRNQTIVRRYYYEAQKLSDSIYEENEFPTDEELDHDISDSGHKKNVTTKARTWDKKMF